MRALLTLAGAKDVQTTDFDAAFVHESAVHEKLADRSNERLEFLGDALLGAIVSRSIFERYPDAPEGELALRKSALVSDAALAASAERLGFEPLLITSVGLRNEPPERRRSVLGDSFEAFVAVLTLRCGIDVATRFVAREHIDVRETEHPVIDDPKTVLQEWSLRRFRTVPTYREQSEGPSHAPEFLATVEIDATVAQGRGSTKRAAQREAAAAVIELLRERYDDVAARALSKAAVPGTPSATADAVLEARPPKRRVGVYKKSKTKSKKARA